MITLERSQKLLSILRKREQTPEMVARIARVEAEIASLKPTPNPAPIPAPEPIIKKKKKKIIKEIEVDDEDEEE
jgi:hypothetical protein